MPAYWVARSKINDPVEYKRYTDLVPAIIAAVHAQATIGEICSALSSVWGRASSSAVV